MDQDTGDNGGGGSSDSFNFDIVDEEPEHPANPDITKIPDSKEDEPDKKKEEEEGKSDPEHKEDDKQEINGLDDLLESDKQEDPELGKVNFAGIAKALGFESEKEIATLEDFKSHYESTLEKSRKEVNLDGYSPSAKAAIQLIEAGKESDLLNNQAIFSSNTILAMEPEEKVYEFQVEQLIGAGLSEEEAEAKATEFVKGMSQEAFLNRVNEIDAAAKKVKSDEILRLHAETEAFTKAQKERMEATATAERAAIVKTLETTKDFFGMELGEKTKATIKAAVENGSFEKALSNNKPEALLNAYMLQTFGAKILKNLEATVKQAGQKNLMEGMKLILKHLPTSSSGKAEVQSSKDDTPFPWQGENW